MKQCQFEECNRKVEAKGLCHTHYQQQRAGKPLTPIRLKDAGRGCKADGCTAKHYAGGLCQSHYEYMRRHGTLDIAIKECSADGCRLVPYSKGMCKKHYSSWYYYERMNNPRPIDTRHHNFKPTTHSPETIHNRIRSSRGTPRSYSCVDCGKQATEWSLKHDAAGRQQFGQESAERYRGTFYSADVMDYDPRCGPCHRVYDSMHENRKFKIPRMDTTVHSI